MSGIEYKVRTDNGHVVFEAYTGTDECFTIPDEVTEIAEGAFAENKSLRHIDLGNTLCVGAFAFWDCSNLETVVMDNVRSIGPGAFEFCCSLRSISIGAVTDIGEKAFHQCRQLDISKIPRSLVSAGAGAFSHTNIRTACLNWLEEIPEALFSGSTNLTYADISGARVIGMGAFEECRSLATVRFDAAEIIESKAFCKCSSFVVEKLPDTLLAIGDEAFERVRDGLAVPGSVRHFGKNCFGPVGIRKIVSIYRSSLYDLRNYFKEEIADDEEDEHFYMWESAVDFIVRDNRSGARTGYLPLFTDLDRGLRAKLIDALKADDTFDYGFIDTELFDGLRWNRRCRDSIALKRLKYPYDLGEDAQIKYTAYLKKHSERIARSAVRDNDPDTLVFLFDGDFMEQEKLRDILDYSISLGSHDCTAFLLGRNSKIQEYADSLPGEL